METLGTLVFLVLLIFTIVHMWKRVNVNFFLKLIIAIAIFFSMFGLVIYWIWFFVKKPSVVEGEKEVEAPKSNFLTSAAEPCTYAHTVWFYEHVAENFPKEEWRVKYLNLFVNFMTNPVLSVDDKLKILELHEKKLKELYPNDPVEKCVLYVDGLSSCYKLLEMILGEDLKILVQSDKGELEQDIDDGTIASNSMTKYLTPIFGHSALIRGKQKEFYIETSIWEKYNIPNFIDEC